MNFQLMQIGRIQKDKQGFYIQLEEKYKEGLISLKGFSHINVLWWGHVYDTLENREKLVINKPYKPGPDNVGVFATRSPIRPNPILLSVIIVSDIDMKNGRIYTPYIDAEPNTAILDIKPYFPCTDISKNAVTPKWCNMLPESIEGSSLFDWSTFFNF